MKLRARLALFSIFLVSIIVLGTSTSTLYFLEPLVLEIIESNNVTLLGNLRKVCEESLISRDDILAFKYIESLEKSIKGLSYAAFVDNQRSLVLGENPTFAEAVGEKEALLGKPPTAALERQVTTLANGRKVINYSEGVALRQSNAGRAYLGFYEDEVQRNIQKLVAEPQYDYWLNMDGDNFPIEEVDVLDLVELDLDVVCCPVPVWTAVQNKDLSFLHWGAYDFDGIENRYKQHAPRQGLQPVSGIGGGVFMMAARVWRHRDMQHGAFARIWNDDGTVRYGNDLSFSMRALKAGFKLWAHYDYPCHHLKTVDLGLVLATIGRAYAEGRRDGQAGSGTPAPGAPAPQHASPGETDAGATDPVPGAGAEALRESPAEASVT